jgi:hypothetical protein
MVVSGLCGTCIVLLLILLMLLMTWQPSKLLTSIIAAAAAAAVCPAGMGNAPACDEPCQPGWITNVYITAVRFAAAAAAAAVWFAAAAVCPLGMGNAPASNEPCKTGFFTNLYQLLHSLLLLLYDLPLLQCVLLAWAMHQPAISHASQSG